MATVLTLSSHLLALRRVFGRAGPVLKKKKLQSHVISCPQRQQGTFHVHRCLFLFLSAPLPTSAPLRLIPHAVTFHVSCLQASPASLLSTIPSTSLHERHMLASPCDSAGWNPFIQTLARIWEPLFLPAAVPSVLGPVHLTPDAPELSHIPGSGLTSSNHICF